MQQSGVGSHGNTVKCMGHAQQRWATALAARLEGYSQNNIRKHTSQILQPSKLS